MLRHTTHTTTQQPWLFSVDCPDAEQVFLVKEDVNGATRWLPMSRAFNGRWELAMASFTMPGVRYYTVERGAILNCGTAGLSATRQTPQRQTPPAMAATA